MKKSWTVDDVLALNPCQPDYSRENLEKIFKGKKRITFLQVLNLNIPIDDIIWFCVRVMNEKQWRIFGGLCAFSVLDIFELQPNDTRVRECIAVVLSENPTPKQLVASRAASRAAAWDAAWAALRDASRDASRAAAWAALRAASRAAARAASRAASRDASRDAAWDVAWVASRAAAWAALRDASRDAAWLSERELQLIFLWEAWNV